MCEKEEECCHLCLSTERRLSSLEGVLDVYLLLVGSDSDGDCSVKDVRGCWECLALLRRVARFRRQAQYVRDVLDTADDLLLDKDTCLSKLKCATVLRLNIKNAKIELSIERRIISIDIEPKPITGQEPSQTSQDRQVSRKPGVSINDIDPLALCVKVEEEETTHTNGISRTEPTLNKENEHMNINEEVYDNSTCFQKHYENKLNKKLVFSPVTQLKSSVSQQSEDHQEPVKMKQAMVILKKIYMPQVNSNDMTKSVFVHMKQENDNMVGKLKSGGSSPQSFNQFDDIPDSDSEPRDIKFNNIKMTSAVENRDTKHKVSIESIINEKKHPSSLLKNIILTLSKDPELQSSHVPINRPTAKTPPQSVLSKSVTPCIETNGSETIENPESKQLRTFRSPVETLNDSQTGIKQETEINAKQFYESFHSNKSYDTNKLNDSTIINIPVTRSQLNDFLERARNNEKYLASPFKCKFCILGFKKESSLKKHMDIYNHVLDPNCNFTCEICHRGMPNQNTLDAHQSTHRFLYSCVAEDFVSVSPQIVLRHYARMHAKKNPKPTEQKVQNKFLYEVITPSEEDLKNMAKALNFTPSTYSCNDCCRHYCSEKRFLKHRELHSEEAGAHACEYCKMRFPTEDKLSNHQPIHENWYRCKADPSCQYIAPTYQDLYYSHYKKHYNTYEKTMRSKERRQARRAKRLEIMAANRRFEVFKPTKEELKNMKLLTGFKPSVVTCDNCCLYFRTDDEVFQHRQLHSDAAGPHMCSVCTQRFTSAELLTTHRRVHDTWYRCKAEGCKFMSNTLPRMQGHTAKHGQKKRTLSKIRKRVGPFQCEICKKVFGKSVNLQAHIRTHYKQYMCDTCGELLVSRTALAIHMRTHILKDKYFYCEYCPKRYSSANKLKYHTNEHLKLYPLSCSKCEAKFPNPSKRRAHMLREHELFKRKTQSKCSVCSVVFKGHYQLMEHYMIHEELFKYKCDRCPRVFMMYNNLVNHQTKHVSGPSLECDMCGRMFYFVSSLNLHKYRTHKKQVCAVCGRRFSSLKALLTHKKLRHASEDSIAREK